MKKRTFYAAVAFAFLSFSMVSCGSESSEHVDETVVETEEEVQPEKEVTFSAKSFFTDKGCVACHQADTKTIGPALTEITEGYNEDKEAISNFLFGNAEAIIDPSQAPLMAPQVKMTQDLSEEEMNELVDFIFSHK